MESAKQEVVVRYADSTRSLHVTNVPTCRADKPEDIPDDGEYECEYIPHSDPEFSDEEQEISSKIGIYCVSRTPWAHRTDMETYCRRITCPVADWCRGHGPLIRRYGFPKSPKFAMKRSCRCLGRHVKQKEPAFDRQDVNPPNGISVADQADAVSSDSDDDDFPPIVDGIY